jgi:predicted MFS family arabinose efflux permease
MSTRKLFFILFSLNLLNYIDRQVLYSVFPLLKTELMLTDLQLGTLASVFMVVYMCYAPLVGYFADRTPRPRWIAASALMWSAATLFCATAKNYLSLLLARGFIGIGEGGFTTIAQPFLAEKYPQEKRATALALFGLALSAGSALGYLLGGVIGQHWGWKAAFMLAGIPGVFLGIWAGLGLKDEQRLNQPKENKPKITDYLSLLKNKPFLFICLAHAMITFIIGGLSAWMPTYLHRYLGMNIAQAGTLFGALVVICGAMGTYMGGKAADFLLKKTNKAYFWVMGFSLSGLLLPTWLGVQTQHSLTAIICFGIAIICLFLPTGPISAAIMAATRSKIHSMAFAVNIFIIHALGDAFSPILLGRISDSWNLKIAVLCCCLAAIPGIIFCWLASCFERRSPQENSF